jgi:hypothetical protein
MTRRPYDEPLAGKPVRPARDGLVTIAVAATAAAVLGLPGLLGWAERLDPSPATDRLVAGLSVLVEGAERAGLDGFWTFVKGLRP